jgi:AraC-like DNA-binding protein
MLRLRRTTIDRFRRRPEGAVVVENCWLYYCVDRGLMGYAGWGVPTIEDFEKLVPCLEVPLAKSAPPHVSIVDLRRLGPLGSQLFTELARYDQDRHAISAKKVIRQVIVSPRGYSRALLVGFRELIKPPYEVVFVDTEEEAARAAERPDAIELLAELARLMDGPLRARVAQILVDSPGDVAAVARRVELSPRTLQRRLASEGTSFAQIVREAMVERAKVLLAASDDKLEVIARRVGCPSASHFTASFRRVTGETPSAWRARNARSS